MRHPTFGNPFTKKERRAAFEKSVDVLSKMFPDARPSFIRAQAWSVARKVPVEPKASRPKSDRKARPAVTYRPLTRAERQGDHEFAMREKAKHRSGGGPRYRVLANLSKRHPDYGCTPAEHARRKAARLL